MSSPNMSGRTDAPTTTDDADHLNPADLLGEDGTVDIGKVKQITNSRDSETLIGSDRCQEIRERLATDEETATGIAGEFGVGSTLVRTHATGDCGCCHETPPVAFERGEGWSVDADPSDVEADP